ncbi:MAG: DUF6084 family protein [Candidatus Dormibacteraeota bacterium]|nr:DUF6084 family protein [Candidatus Dormibacteraeota bacterium]
MPDLTISVERASAIPYAAVPTLGFTLAITEQEGIPIEAVSLQCQLRIEATRRRYSTPEKQRLEDLFGAQDRWAQTLRTFLWTHASVPVPRFEHQTRVELPVGCTFDFEVVATKYIYALEEGEIPLILLFSGTIFFRDEEGALQIAQIPWETEASFRLPVAVWKDVMRFYYPNAAWLYLHQDVFDSLLEYKTRHGIPTWDAALERLLAAASVEARP